MHIYLYLWFFSSPLFTMNVLIIPSSLFISFVYFSSLHYIIVINIVNYVIDPTMSRSKNKDQKSLGWKDEEPMVQNPTTGFSWTWVFATKKPISFSIWPNPPYSELCPLSNYHLCTIYLTWFRKYVTLFGSQPDRIDLVRSTLKNLVCYCHWLS